MRFPRLASQTDIDAQLQRCKPRYPPAPPLPWLPALVGLTAMLVMQTLL